jgi:prepilin-type N-terminal cleavage/methylation domain-containing protein
LVVKSFLKVVVVKTNDKWQVTGDGKLRAPRPVSRHSSLVNHHSAFTLIELLVVIVILGILAGLAVPALKNIGKSDANTSAARQLLDDVGRARQMAISRHTTVYMLFISTNFWLPPFTSSSTWTSGLSSVNFQTVVNLNEKQLSGYGFFARGALGDQPGNHQPHYLSDQWQSLPNNSFIAGWKFLPRADTNSAGGFTVNGFDTAAFPFPTATNAPVMLPFIAFNYLGQLTTNSTGEPSYMDEFIPLAQGTVSYGYDGTTKSPLLTVVGSGGVNETPPGNSTDSRFNLVHIDALTGRARLEFQKLQ